MVCSNAKLLLLVFRVKKGNTNVENEFVETAYCKKLCEMKIRFITFNDFIH